MANKINVLEVGPRDGWQNLKQMLTFEQKLELIGEMFDAGVQEMEVTSFVSPKAIPQMADASELAKACIGIAAFGVAALLFLLGVADDAKAIKALPWGTIVMVLSVGALLDIVNAMGGIDLMSQGTVFEKGKRVGGMMMNGIPSFRLEKDVVSAEIDIIRRLGVEFRCGVDVGKDVTIQQLREQGYKAFFLAIGAQGARMAGIPGEDGDGVISAVDLMYNLSIDENEKLPGRTVVIGGGNVATDVARAAMRAGSESVSLFCLESWENTPASVEEIDESEKEGISINNAWGPAEICLNDGKVQAVRFKKCLSTTDGNGSFAPRYDEDDTVTIECDNVVLAVGQRIIWGNLLKGTAVQLNPNGTVVADPVTLQTAEPDIFSGGDALTGPKWTIDAIASGKEGSVSLHRFVQPHSSLTIGRNLRKFIELDKTTTAIPVGFDNTPRQLPGYDESLRKTFRDGHTGFTEEQVRKETGRCLGCGASVVDPNKCIGCGQCTTKCVFDAIHLHREHPECSRMNPVEDMVKKVIPYKLKRQVKIKLNSLSGKK